MERVDPSVAGWAISPDGLAAIADATAAIAAGTGALALGTRLREGLSPERAAFVAQAAEARTRALAAGVPGAEQLVLTREAAEQASAPAVAAWRAALLGAAIARGAASHLVDLCAGTGGDAVELAGYGPTTAVERDPGRALLAEHRAAVLGVDLTVMVGDALAPPVELAGAVVHADPDRRDATGRRARTLAQHGPSVAALLAATSAAAGRMVTVAPGVDWADPDLPEGASVSFLQVGIQLTEAVICDGVADDELVRGRAVLLPEGRTVTRAHGPRERLAVGAVGTHLLLPAPAAVRARVHDQLAAEASSSARRVADRRALLTADEPCVSPWWRCEPVLDVLPARPKAVRAWLQRNPDRVVELLTHGMTTNVSDFLRAAGNPLTGPQDVRVHLVRRDADAVAIITGPPRQH